jgi:flagellar motor protein MotB
VAGRAHEELDQDGEGYFASVSDLMVGILFIFLLMLTVFALNFRSSQDELQAQQHAVAALAGAVDRERAENERLRRSLGERRADLLAVLARLRAEVDERRRRRAELLEVLRRELAAQGLRVQIDPDSGVLRLAEEDLRFASGKAELPPADQPKLQVLARAFDRVLPCFAAGAEARCGGEARAILETVLVEGHTDLRPVTTGPFPDNYALSAARALTVYRAILAAAPPLGTLANAEGQPLLAVSGYGETRPLPEHRGLDERSLAANRRIDIRFILSARVPEEIERLMRDVDALLRGSP